MFSDLICLPLPHTSMYMLTQMPRFRSSVSLSRLHLTSYVQFWAEETMKDSNSTKYLPPLRAVKNIQYPLPVDAPQKFDWEFLVMTCALVYVGTMPKSMHGLSWFKLQGGSNRNDR